MFLVPRKSLPIDLSQIHLKSDRPILKRASVDLNNPQLVVKKKGRLQKLDSIIKSTKKYNSSLQNLRNNWSITDSRNSSKVISLSKQIQPQSQFSSKVNKLCNKIKTTFVIFSELFAQTRNKKQIFRKLHVWESQFEAFFFEQNSINLKRINKNELINRFGLDRKTGKSETYYNKLKLMLEQINKINEKRYQLLSQIQLQKIQQKLKMIQNINDEFKRNYHGKDKFKYEGMAKKTIDKLSGFKNKIWNKNQAMKYIQHKTGPIEVNWVLRQQQKKIQRIQNIFLKSDYC